MNARRITPRYLLPSFFLVIFRPVIYNEAGHPLCQCVSCYFRVVLCIYKKFLLNYTVSCRGDSIPPAPMSYPSLFLDSTTWLIGRNCFQKLSLS